MDWEATGVIAKLVGAVGVIVTLFYVALQIRQNTNQLRGEAISTVNEAEVILFRDFRDDLDLISAYVKVSNDWDSGSAQQQARAHIHMIAWVRAGELAYNLWKSDALPESIYKTREELVVSILGAPGSRKWCDLHNTMFEADFVKRITKRVDQKELPSPLEAQPCFNPEYWN
jgi:hypothetical protein